MTTNQKFHTLRLPPLFFILLFSLSSIGQNFISDIKLNGRSIPRLDIIITTPEGKSSTVEITRNTAIKSESIINVPSAEITVYLTSINGNVVEIAGPSTLQFRVSEKREEYRLIEGGESSNILVNVFKELTGGVLASGPTNRIQARSRATKFLLRLDGKDLDIVLKNGKIDVNRRDKIEIKDEIVIGNDNKRALFVRNTKQLSLKDSIINYNPNGINIQSLTADSEINKFFNYQFKRQKKDLLKAGIFSKAALKDLDNGESIDEGILSFDKAIENGELGIDLIIQSAFLFADFHFKKDDINKSKVWLEAGLHFGKIFYDTNQGILNNFETNNKLANAFRYDMLIANEYYAWGYDLKLKINGCLENADENPSKYRSNAKKLVEKYKL